MPVYVGLLGAYVKINNNQLMLRVVNNEQWNQIYIQEKFYNDFEMYDMSSIPINSIKRKILTGNPITKHEKFLYEQDLWNFLFINERIEEDRKSVV